jgi:hypothetical protein
LKPPKKIFFHLLGWIVFISLPIFLFPKPENLFKLNESFPYIVDNIIINIICVTFFYLNFYFFIPKFYFQKKYFTFLGLILLFFFCTILFVKFIHPPRIEGTKIPTNEAGMPIFSENPLAPPSPLPRNSPKNNEVIIFVYGQIIFKLIITFLLSLAFRIYGKWQLAEKEKIRAELSFLKAQINPHFLFNTLNGIYTLAIKKSDNTPNAILKLSSIMRYVINEGHHDYVSLEHEIKYIEDFVSLHKMRLASNITLDYQINVENKTLKIAPLLLISFIENAFKHGLNTQEDCQIDIHILEDKNVLNLFVKNKIYITELREEEKSGIGIENTKKRLSLLYPNNHSLNISNRDNYFVVDLKINLS